MTTTYPIDGNTMASITIQDFPGVKRIDIGEAVNLTADEAQAYAEAILESVLSITETNCFICGGNH